MTKENAEKLLPFIKAYAEGKQLQIFMIIDGMIKMNILLIVILQIIVLNPNQNIDLLIH